MNINKIKKIVLYALKVLISAIVVLSINIELNKRASLHNGNSVIYLFEFIITSFVVAKIYNKVNNRMLIVSSVLAICGAFIEIIGFSINNCMDLSGIFDSPVSLRNNLIKLVGNFFIFDIAIIIIFTKIDKIKKKLNVKNKTKKSDLFLYWIIILICWIPYFINYYPGLTTSDSMVQIFQSLNLYKLTAHHPLIHTFLIGICMNFGKIINNYTIGVAMYTVVQMLIMSLIFATTVYIMKKRNIPNICRIITILFYAIYPINPLFSLMMWKDIIFAGLMLLFILSIQSLVSDENAFLNSKKKILGFILLMVILMFFRNNGVYVILLTAIVSIFILRKHYKKMIVIFSSAILIYYVLNNAIIFMFNIEKAQVREALSIPMQQIARIVTYHKSELSEQEMKDVNKYIRANNIDELYNPVISDPIKNYFDSNAFSENKIDFIKLWLKFLVKFPKDYVESFICNSYGYYYPEAKHWVANRTMEKDNILGLHSQPIFKINFVSKIDSLIERRDIPFLSMFFSIGFIFWIIILALCYCIYERKYKKILMYIPIIMLWLTTLASPVFCEFRYVYSFVTCLPVLIMTVFQKEEERD